MHLSLARSLLSRSIMRRIHKGKEPKALEEYRAQLPVPPPKAAWDEFTQKDGAMHSVTQEQRELCAFCQGRMACKRTGMKLAHVIPQNGTSEGELLRLTWSNIVGACRGGDTDPRPRLLHCDSLQGNTPLLPQLDPVQFVNGSLHYNLDGEIHSPDRDVEAQIENVLGLNRKPVLRKRLEALDGVDGIKSLLKSSPEPERQREELIDLLDPDHPSDQPLPAYADFLLWCLHNWDLVVEL